MNKGGDHLGRGARLTESHSELMKTIAFGLELDEYSDLWRWLSIADMAHVRCLWDSGVIDPELGSELLRELLAIHSEPIPDLDAGLGDLYNNRDAMLRERVGPISDWIHTGRARREATTLAWQLESRHQMERTIAAVRQLVSTMTNLARSHSADLMPDFTYLQHAHPTTLGHYILTFAYPLSRDLDRLVAALERVNRSPAGSGSVNGSRFGLDRAKMAADLEFDGLIVHNRDAMWAPDIALEPASIALSAFVTIDRLAEELMIWSTSEFAYFETADRHARTSVIMPQKKNPYGLAMIRGRARSALGTLVTVVSSNFTPSGQPDNRVFAYGQVPQMLRDLTGTALLLAEHLELGEFDTDRLREASSEGFTASTEICDWMTQQHGVSNRTAHTVVGRAVRVAIDRGHTEIAVGDLAAAAEALGLDLPPISEEDLATLQDPAETISQREGRGSVADIDTMADSLTDQLANLPDPRFDRFEERFIAATAALIEERNAP